MRSGQGAWIAVVTGVLVPVLILPLVIGVSLKPKASPLPGAAEIARFQSMANAACRCARRRPAQKGACWVDFDKAIALYEHSESFIPCEPAYTNVCFDRPGVSSNAYDPALCVIRTRNVGRDLCSDDEERVISAILNRRIPDDPAAWRRVQMEIDRAVDGFTRGDTPRPPRGSSPGCSGG